MKFKDLPGFPKLFVDYVEQAAAAQRFYPCPPNLQSIRKHASEIQQRPLPRGAICRLLEEQALRFNCGARARENIDRLRDVRVVAVVTSLQPGLLGGPLRNFLKCLTVIKLAHTLSEGGIPSIPLAIMPSETQDSNGARNARLLDHDGVVNTLSLDPQIKAGLEFRGRLVPRSSIETLVKQIEEVLDHPPSAAEVFQLIHDSYSPEGDLFAGSARFLSSLTAEWGLVLLDASSAELENLQAPIFELMTRESTKIQHVLNDQAERLRQEGYPVSTPVKQKTFLQPMVLGCILPTVIHVADPNEMTDFALVLPLYHLLQSPPLIVWPRVSATVMDGRSRKILEKHGRDLKDLFSGPEILLEELVEEKLAPDTAARLDAISREVEGRLASLQSALPPEDRRLVNVIEDSRSKMLYQIGKLKEGFLSSQTLRRQAMARQIDRICRHLTPEGQLQEERLALVYFLLRYSRDLLHVLYDKIDPWKLEHQIIIVD